jgi:formylglycine-generating enzyme required for sulfatase activity
LLSALGLVLPAAGQVSPYGSGVNPPGSLVVTSGVPQVGQSFNVGVSNTAISAAPASLAFLGIASAADPAFPAGTVVPGFGLSSPGSLGEVLISWVSPNPLLFLGAVPWAGGTAAPAQFTISVPSNPALSGVTFYLQGTLVDPATYPSVGMTNGLAVKLAPPGATALVPCVSEIPGMAIIPSGTFQMGSDAPSGHPYFGEQTTQPVHQVTISYCFWMGRHEVTQAEYEARMGTNPASFVGPSLPVEGVSWFNALEYCAALTAQYSSLGVLPVGYAFRLPTEAEWEYACRAGTTTEFNITDYLLCDQARFAYSWHANSYCLGWQSGTTPVGSYPANAWGLHDMHGNVWELCLDSFGAGYPAGPVTNPFYDNFGPHRVIRGGSWRNNSDYCRSAKRWRHPDGIISAITIKAVGFRVVLAPVFAPWTRPSAAGPKALARRRSGVAPGYRSRRPSERWCCWYRRRRSEAACVSL